MIKTISKFSIIGIFVLVITFLLISPISFVGAEGILLEDYGTLLSEDNITDLINNNNSSEALGTYVEFIIKLSFGLGSIAAVVLIIWGGIEYIMDGSKFTKKEDGKKKITHALGAIAILALSFVFFQQVNPEALVIRFKPIGGDVGVDKVEVEEINDSSNYKTIKACAVDGKMINDQREEINNGGVDICTGGYTEKGFTNPKDCEKTIKKNPNDWIFFQKSCVENKEALTSPWILFYIELKPFKMSFTKEEGENICIKVLKKTKNYAKNIKTTCLESKDHSWYFEYQNTKKLLKENFI